MSETVAGAGATAATRDAPGGSGASAEGSGRAFGARLMTPLLLGSLLNPLNSTMIATALVAIGQDFHVGAAGTAWLLSAIRTLLG